MLSFLDITNVPIRLVSGNGYSSGRVEIYLFGTWGTVCENNFNIVAANVACKQLGFPGAVSFRGGLYGSGRGKILLEGVNCKGKENSLASCDHLPWGKHNCEHRQDVGINCETYRR